MRLFETQMDLMDDNEYSEMGKLYQTVNDGVFMLKRIQVLQLGNYYEGRNQDAIDTYKAELKQIVCDIVMAFTGEEYD